MKPTDTLTTLFSHNLWANVHLFEQCAELTSEQLETTLSGTFGSIKDTLLHIARAEEAYLYRISTGQPIRRPENTPPLTMAEMVESVRKSGSGLIEWATKVQTNDTVKINWVDDSTRDVPKAIILTQAINHATEHRAQINAILTQLGVQPLELDSWTYFEARDK